LGDERNGMWAINSASASAQVGSPHYADQFDMWRRGEYRYLSLNADEAAKAAVGSLDLTPTVEGS
jgi:acyl-homoserine lactone acylase PvdQ